jgi:hypothetical protein
VASAPYLFAMKCLAMRSGGAAEGSDVDDIRQLAADLNLKTASEAIDVIARFYPLDALPPRTRFGLEEMLGSGDA